MLRLICFLLSAYLFSACQDSNSHDNFELSSFEIVSNLTGKKIIFPEIMMPDDIIIKNGKIVISDRSNYNAMHVLDKTSLKYLFPKGIKGVGPNEQLIIKKLDKGIHDDNFYAYDGQLKKLFEYSLNDSLRLSTGIIDQNESWNLANNLTWTASGNLISNTLGENRYVVYDTKGGIVNTFGKWSELMPKEEDNFIISDLYQGNFSGNISNSIYVLACSLTDHFEILDLNTGKIRIIEGPVNKGIEFNINGAGANSSGVISNNQTLGYNGVFVGSESVFLVYIGKSLVEYAREQYASKDIFQFDLQGNPIAHYSLDIPIRTISVVESERKIYAITDDENPGVAVFEY